MTQTIIEYNENNDNFEVYVSKDGRNENKRLSYTVDIVERDYTNSLENAAPEKVQEYLAQKIENFCVTTPETSLYESELWQDLVGRFPRNGQGISLYNPLLENVLYSLSLKIKRLLLRKKDHKKGTLYQSDVWSELTDFLDMIKNQRVYQIIPKNGIIFTDVRLEFSPSYEEAEQKVYELTA